jgi:hypothetical protein
MTQMRPHAFDVIEAEEVILPDRSKIGAGAAAIRDAFTLDDRKNIQTAKGATSAYLNMALGRLTFAPGNVELASMVAQLEKGDSSEADRVAFLRAVETKFPHYGRRWLSDMRKAVQNILHAPDRTAARGADYNVVNEDDFRTLVGHGLRCLREGHSIDPTLFSFGSEVAEIRKDKLTGYASIETLGYQTFKARVNETVEYRVAEGGEKRSYRGVSAPDDVAQTLYARHDLPVPALRSVARTPVFDAEGSLIRVPGYHKESGLFYAPPDGLALDLPRRVTEEDVKSAITDLCDLFADFEMDGLSRSEFEAAVLRGEGATQWNMSMGRGGHFVHGTGSPVPPSFLACVAWLLEQPCRLMIDGPVMPLLISKTAPGAGGGLLAKAMQIIVQGSTSSRQLAKTEDERRKAIFTMLKGSASTIFWDNLPSGKEVNSEALASLFTELYWTDRELGRSGERSLPVRASFVLVGNRPLFSDELRRRLSLCELLPQTDTPSARTGFKYPALLTQVTDNRGKYLRAVLVLAMNWIQKGRPAPKRSKAPGSYEAWHAVIVGILEAAAPHWITWGANRGKLTDIAGADDTDEMDSLLHLWAAEFGVGRDVEASEICSVVARLKLELPLKLKPHGDECEYSSKSLAHYLKSFAGKVFRVDVTERVQGKMMVTEKKVTVQRSSKRGDGGYPWVLTEITR